jgi:radical SAM superfamily enzyme with C-terminal helix-hairpin-helix motif
MNELENIVKEVAAENTALVVNASLRQLAELVSIRANEKGRKIPPPAPSHMRKILLKLGYKNSRPNTGSGFVYRHNEAAHE